MSLHTSSVTSACVPTSRELLSYKVPIVSAGDDNNLDILDTK